MKGTLGRLIGRGVEAEKQDLPFLSTAELSELIRQKEVSPVDVTESYLERIDDLNFKFNSYLTVCRKEALQAAQQAEQAIAQGNYLGPKTTPTRIVSSFITLDFPPGLL